VFAFIYSYVNAGSDCISIVIDWWQSKRERVNKIAIDAARNSGAEGYSAMGLENETWPGL